MTHKITNCRGNEKKQQICKDYEVKVISRMALLPGYTIEGCCGDLENEHTIFSYKHKQSKYEDTFSVGKDCAKSFLEILHQKLPPLVDPLQHLQLPGLTSVGGSTSVGGGSSPSTTGNPAVVMPPINAELYVAINLWCILKGELPKYTLQRILENIQSSPSTPLKNKDVFDFLKVLASYNKTLKQLLNEAQNKHLNVKRFSFPIINSIASKNWVDLP